MDSTTMVEHLTRHSVLTGSRALGVANSEADWDYIVPWKVYEEVVLPNIERFVLYEDIAKTKELDEYTFDNKGNICCYIKVDGKQFNFLIFQEDVLWVSWLCTTDLMRYFPRGLTKYKGFRVKMFRFWLKLFSITDQAIKSILKNG